MIRFKTFLLLVCLCTLMPSFAPAQSLPPYDIDTQPQRGFMPNSTHAGVGVDAINVVDGSLNLEIPLASLPRGHGGMGFDLNLIYSSQIYEAGAADHNDPTYGDVQLRI